MKTAWICLGRTGDIINMLPLVLHDYQQGNQPTVITAATWSNLLDGIGYADSLVWNGDYSKPTLAKAWAESLGKFQEIQVPQCYGQRFIQKCSNFCEEAWRLADRHYLWGQLPLVFDRRDKQREQSLIPDFKKPMILVHTQGISSAFHQGSELFEALKPLRETHEIVDLSLVKANRFYDLLGLYEKAQYLVCIDSGPLHLAHATPNLKVIALITDKPSLWHGSPARLNHVLRIRYNEFDKRKGEIPEAIRNGKQSERRFIHVWSDYPRNDLGAQKRHRMAKLTWEKEMAGWIELALLDTDLDRNSRTDFDDFKAAPYVTDMVNKAMEKADLWDIVVLTNDDTCVAPDLAMTLKLALPECGACWGARREHRLINRIMTTTELMQGRKHVGADIFAFTKGWWLKYGHEMPDMLMGFENWDYVMRTIINEHGGRELEGLCYHEIHQGDWTKRRNSPAAKHNQQMGGEFFA